MPAGRAPVILIDDNVEFAGLLGTLIAEQGLMPVLAHTAEDGVSLLHTYPHAVAIALDLLLPDLTGQKLLIKLIKEGTKLPPIFVMTGVFKGVAQQEKVRAICDVGGWYEKPFDTRLLVEQIARLAGIDPVVRKQHRKIEVATVDLEPADIEIDIIEGDLVATTGDIPPPDIDDHPPIGTGDLDAPTVADDEDQEFGASENPTVIEGLPFSHTPTPDEAAMHLRTDLRVGDLSRTTLPSLIAAFYAAQETAEVVFDRSPHPGRKMIYFSRGRPVHAVNDADRSERDTKAIVRSLFSWSSGRYMVGFKVETNMPGSGTAGLPPAQLILEGVRDLFELERLRALVPPKLRPMPSPSSPFALHELPLTDREAMVLLRATGARSVETIVREMGSVERETLAVLYSLLTLGVLVDVRALP